MSKTTIISVLVIVAVAVSGYFIINTKKTENISPTANQLENEETKNETSEKPAGKKMAFSQFIKQDNGAYKCEVKQALSDMENSGTVYMNAGNLRGDFNTIAEGRKVDSSFIIKDGYTYNWSTLAPMGVKVKIQINETADTNAPARSTYSWNAEQIGDYNCEAWVVDESKFTLPSGITFTEIQS